MVGSIKIETLYKQWCTETKRSGGILCPGSIQEFFRWLNEQHYFIASKIDLINPKVQKFANDMHNELKANEPNKGTDWEDWGDVPKMLDELKYHEEKLGNALIEQNPDRIREHLADCGNFLLFIGNAHFLYEE